jgi:type VI secretion system protein ImpK
MTAAYWATADLLAFASQLAQGSLPSSAEQLRTNLTALFTEMRRKGTASGLIPDDITDASYAIMALLDEILVQANWPGRTEWQKAPLQFQYFHENTAGENFFRRAEAYCEQPHKLHVLQIYVLCVSLGFQGRFAMGQIAELEAFQGRMAASVLAACVPTDLLSPHGVPPDAGQSLLQRELPVARLGVACFGGALLVFCVLLLARSWQLSRATEAMRTYVAAATSPAGKP